jgi:PKHD-type hydroxylase
MMVHIPDVLNAVQLAECRRILDAAEWVDGRVTAGHQSAMAKDNMQVPAASPAARQAGELILSVLSNSPLFISAALPLKVFPPLFNRYRGGQAFGNHVDNAIRPVPGTPVRVRTDLSATLFLSPPEDYDGGELTVEGANGGHTVKLPAGHMILYPASSLHRVTPVSRGSRVSSFFWVQSMVRNDQQRSLLFELDNAIQRFACGLPRDEGIVKLTGIYHNLLRMWADT